MARRRVQETTSLLSSRSRSTPTKQREGVTEAVSAGGKSVHEHVMSGAAGSYTELPLKRFTAALATFGAQLIPERFRTPELETDPERAPAGTVPISDAEEVVCAEAEKLGFFWRPLKGFIAGLCDKRTRNDIYRINRPHPYGVFVPRAGLLRLVLDEQARRAAQPAAQPVVPYAPPIPTAADRVATARAWEAAHRTPGEIVARQNAEWLAQQAQQAVAPAAQ